MLKIIKVTGESLAPDLEEGDFVVIATIPFFFRVLRPGDVIVFRHSIYGTLIKRVESLLPGGHEICVVGDHPDSIDSRRFGPIPRRSVIGKVVTRIRKPRR